MRWFGPSSVRRADGNSVMLGAVILILALAAILGITLGFGTTKDLDVYVLAARRFADGATLYGAHFGQTLPDPLPYTYPPFLAAALALIAWLPRSWITVAWTLLDIALLVWVVQVSYTRFLDRLGRRRPVALACLVGVLGLTAPVLSVFDLGQIGLVLMALVLADALPERTRLPRGVLVGVATATKLLPGLVMVYWLIVKRWRAATVAGVTAVGLWGVTAIVRPGVSRTYWFDVLTHPERTGDPAAVMDQSTNGLLHRVGWSSPLVWAVLAFVAIGVGLWRARRAHDAGDELAAISLVAIATLLASPVSWIHHAVWIVPATAVLLGDGTDRRRRVAWAITVAVFLSDAPMLARVGVPLPGATAFLAENAFVFAYWALLLFLPISVRRDAASPETAIVLRDVDVALASVTVR
jgi:alpha-1,2-mannosyltransferase